MGAYNWLDGGSISPQPFRDCRDAANGSVVQRPCSSGALEARIAGWSLTLVISQLLVSASVMLCDQSEFFKELFCMYSVYRCDFALIRHASFQVHVQLASLCTY